MSKSARHGLTLTGPEDVYVLGAGASYVHGAPLTDDLLRHALSVAPDRPQLSLVRQFLELVFHFSPPRNPRAAGWDQVPSLVDVLSIVDVALDRKESLARGFDQDRLRRLRGALEFAIYHALEHALRWRAPRKGVPRSNAIQLLAASLDPANAAIISFNYDVIADIALARRERTSELARADVETLAESGVHSIDYGVEFANVTPSKDDVPKCPLLKLHGSFNWLQSRLTGNLYFGGMQKAVGVLFETRPQRAAADLNRLFTQRSRGGDLGNVVRDLEMVLVTPTHLKDLRNSHLSRIWRRAEECLRRARRVTFIGYSLPGDDLHVKYMFKRALETREHRAHPEIVVVDKGAARTSKVRANYERFFGKSQVNFHGEGFDQWVRKRRALVGG
jgi:hypothetical protein